MPVDAVTPTSAVPPASMITSPTAMTQVDFLQMLTAQIKAQDPMNPMNGQDFASQLAQFSSLQQLQTMGTTADQTLQANLMLAQSFNNTMAASFIGKTVRAQMDEFSVNTSGGATLAYNLSSAATQITVDIKDSTGSIVKTLHVNPQEAGEHTLSWDGTDGNGRHVGAGKYSYSITATDPSGASVTATTIMEGRVQSVNYESGSAVLMINGVGIQLNQVISISDPANSGDKVKG